MDLPLAPPVTYPFNPTISVPPHPPNPNEYIYMHDYDEELDATGTWSVTESVLEHVYENGRRYHLKSLGKYHLPSDDIEQQRLDLYHHLHLELLGGRLHMAKFEAGKEPKRVLDCGTGTGIWALEFGDIYLDSSITGIDIVPIQPEWTAPNVRFELDDLELPWEFPSKFDYIRSRDLVTSIKNWPRYFQQMFENTNPGAVVEIVEHCIGWLCDDPHSGLSSTIRSYNQHLINGLKSSGTWPENTLADYKRMLQEAGFKSVETYEYKIPAGAWPRAARKRKLGRIVLEVVETGLESYGKSVMVHKAGMADKEADDLIRGTLEAMKKEKTYYLVWYLVAKKPL
ncbi:S-adenosyl-L-methionine-dependent methyltransferase [Ascodesmis nigricans]|uniref:S-adenosyl-L-methionine-dependent methyltransferase n=1 Tax=Ascodesmis nigricans TaxID=341454 RepID=A0A4S2MRG3_9PEZI|nr:S-adenosyl-L-methionine-dependent methyltransferase [Ascodesmis nigricans]